MRTILHSDMNACYASIECLHRPELREQPLAVGGDVEKRHGIVLAKNQEAKRFGVRTGEALWQARQKCPHLEIVPPDYRLYLRFSRLVREIYSDYTNQQEAFGLDESWLDVTGSVRGSGVEIAEEIRQRVKAELGVTVSIGVSFNKIFAKLGSDYKKPDAVTVISPENYRQLVWPLPVKALLYVGRATAEKLRSRGIVTIGQLAGAEPEGLHRLLGKMGLVLYQFANGGDTSPVAYEGSVPVIKSVGNSVTTPRDVENLTEARVVLSILCDSVAARLREDRLLAGGVQISLRDNTLFRFERQGPLSRPTAVTGEIFHKAEDLLQQHYSFATPLRSMGVKAIELSAQDGCQQLSFLAEDCRREKETQLERAIDDLRRRFGHGCVRRAVNLLDEDFARISPKEDHIIYPVSYFGPR